MKKIIILLILNVFVFSIFADGRGGEYRIKQVILSSYRDRNHKDEVIREYREDATHPYIDNKYYYAFFDYVVNNQGKIDLDGTEEAKTLNKIFSLLDFDKLKGYQFAMYSVSIRTKEKEMLNEGYIIYLYVDGNKLHVLGYRSWLKVPSDFR